MVLKQISKKVLKVTGIILGILLLLVVAFHFWFIAHAKDLLENLVFSQSKGQLKLKVEKFRFGYFSTKMELEKAVFFNTDTLTSPTAYRFSVNQIKINVNALLPIIFKKQILIDSLSLNDPDIQITRLNIGGKNNDSTKKDFSIPEEMGKVYNSISKALQILHVKRFEINNARFTLINKIQPDQQPLIITNIFFHINNISIDSSEGKGKEKILFGDNAVIRNRNQDITFPDGRHRLSYSRFRINLRKKLVEFDSCTIAATKTGNANASFKVFFDTLLLTNIDFDTLYRHDLIKADSVYCLNPRFDLEVKLGRKIASNKPPPKLDQIIEQLTGDMFLKNVIVRNAGIKIVTLKNDIPSSFSSDHNNFEIQEFSVNEGAAKPLKIKSFVMAIRNYETFLKDSSYSIQFDSILFNNYRISLSNFTLRQFNNGKIINSFGMQQFQLMGISWEDLVFNRKLIANEATLFRPLINYKFEDKPGYRKKQSIFPAMASIGNFIKLNELKVADGTIQLHLKKDVELLLQNANLTIRSKDLLRSKKITDLENSLDELQFQTGIIKTPDITVELGEVHYNGSYNNLVAGSMKLNDRQKTISALAEQVSLDSIKLDDSTKSLEVSGLQWKKADITINLAKKENTAPNTSSILVKNIKGENTTIKATSGERTISTFLQTVSLNNLGKQQGSKINFDNPYAEGQKLSVADAHSLLTISDYSLADRKKSSFKNINYSSNKDNDSIHLAIPLVTFAPDIKAAMDGKGKANDLEIVKPEVLFVLSKHPSSPGKKETKLPILELDHINIQQPEINFSQTSPKGQVKLEWNGNASKNNVLSLTAIKTDNGKISIKQTGFTLNHFMFTNEKGKIFKAGNGEITAQLKNINISRPDNLSWDWSSEAETISATNFVMDSLGKQSGRMNLDRIKLENFFLSSSTFTNPARIADENSNLRIKELTGQYNNPKSHFSWFNAGFDQKLKTITVDSFVFHPTLDRETYLARQPFQSDYLRTRTGTISIDGVDPSLYFRDSVFKINTISIDNMVLTDFRDTRPPFHAG
ncbi:MAG: hypothetical protein ABUT20_14260, partial [Bacteroidota bacterium]